MLDFKGEKMISKECEFCLKNYSYCSLPRDNFCPCKKCILKNICSDICEERKSFYKGYLDNLK